LKLTKEIKTAVLVLASIALFIWGYSFLKGKDLLNNYKILYTQYDNVEGLNVSSPVTISGMNVGKVSKISIDNNTGKVTVEMQIKSDFPINKTSKAEIYAPSPIGGKQIAIFPSFSGALAATGDTLISSSKLGLTDELAKQIIPLKDKISKLLDNANVLVENLNQFMDSKTKENLKSSLANLNETIVQFKAASTQVNSLLADNKSKINGTLTNIEKATVNFSKVSDTLAKVNIGPTVKNLQKTLENVDKMMADMQAGKGTMGKLIKDDALYNNFNKTSKELELLLQDLRLNPTRYVNVSLFGKKNRPYTAPVNDTLKKK
jgi:phospholipid/cholesterol/gamma-HCH transport system substrate-binding protein